MLSNIYPISETKVLPSSCMSFSIGFSNSDKPFIAGVEAVNNGLDALSVKEISLAIAVISRNYEYKKVIEGIKQIIPNTPLFVIFQDDIITYQYASDKGVAVGLFSKEINVQYYLAKGFSLSSKKALKDAFSEILNEPKLYKNDILLFFIPGSIPLVGQNSVVAIEEISNKFDCIVGGVMGKLNSIEYQTFIIDEKAYTDHAVILRIQTNHNFSIFQSYGFHPVRPFIITSAKGDIIISLDDQSAFHALLNTLSKRGIDDGQLKDPVKAQKILSNYQFAIADKSRPGLFRSLVPLAVTEKGIRVNSFVSENSTIWLMEFSKDEIFEGVDKMSTRILNNLKSISGGIIFENVVRKILLGNENYVKEKKIIWDNLRVPFLVIETIEEIVYSEDFYSGSHSGSILSIFYE
ncbi:MAG: FIST N-terminal domain-containing protein [candidate division WOR-3 bacterium]